MQEKAIDFDVVNILKLASIVQLNLKEINERTCVCRLSRREALVGWTKRGN